MTKKVQIVFIDALNNRFDSFHDDRQGFYRQLQEDYGILVAERITEELCPDIVFVHQSFLFQSNLMESSSKRNSSLLNAIFVFYGNNEQGTLEITSDEISYFNFYNLRENFRAFYEEIDSDGLQSGSWNTLLGFDPELERLLAAFSTLSPFENKLPPWTDEYGAVKTRLDGTRLTIKDELVVYVNQKLEYA